MDNCGLRRGLRCLCIAKVISGAAKRKQIASENLARKGLEVMSMRLLSVDASVCLCRRGSYVCHRPVLLSDATFQGSNLNGWQTLGDADWRAENGEVVGTLRR